MLYIDVLVCCFTCIYEFTEWSQKKHHNSSTFSLLISHNVHRYIQRIPIPV